MDNQRQIAAIVLILAAAAWWLHDQGKLLPILRVLFGSGNDPLNIVTGTAPASTAQAIPSGGTLLQRLTNLTIGAIKALPPSMQQGGSGGSSPFSGYPAPATDGPGYLPPLSPNL